MIEWVRVEIFRKFFFPNDPGTCYRNRNGYWKREKKTPFTFTHWHMHASISVCVCVCFVSKIFVFLENQPIIIISFVHHHHLCHFFSAWNNQTIYGFRHLFIKTIDDDNDEDDDDNYRSQINRKIGLLLLFVVDHQFFLWPFFLYGSITY